MDNTQQIQKLAQVQDLLLQRNEYFGRSLVHPVEREWFRKSLQLHLTRILSAPEPKAQTSDFFINTSALFKHGSDRVDFKFHYQYDQQGVDLRIRGVQFRMGDITKYSLLASNTELRSASDLYKLLSNERKIKSAMRIVCPVKAERLNLFKTSGWLVK